VCGLLQVGGKPGEKKENTATKAHALISSDIDHRFIPTHSCVLRQDIAKDCMDTHTHKKRMSFNINNHNYNMLIINLKYNDPKISLTLKTH